MWTNKVSFGIIEKRMGLNLITKLDDTSWQKEFLEMKSHSTSEVRLLMQGAKGFREAWHLGSLHEEYKIMKRREHQQQQKLNNKYQNTKRQIN